MRRFNLEREKRLRNFTAYRLSEADCATLYTSVTGKELPKRERRRFFISYSHKDTLFTERLVHDLKDSNLIDIWIDTSVIGKDGASEAEVIDAVGPGIRSCELLLLALSENSVQSSWVEREVGIANLFRGYRNPSPSLH
jgi:hypothetical protein